MACRAARASHALSILAAASPGSWPSMTSALLRAVCSSCSCARLSAYHPPSRVTTGQRLCECLMQGWLQCVMYKALIWQSPTGDLGATMPLPSMYCLPIVHGKPCRCMVKQQQGANRQQQSCVHPDMISDSSICWWSLALKLHTAACMDLSDINTRMTCISTPVSEVEACRQYACHALDRSLRVLMRGASASAAGWVTAVRRCSLADLTSPSTSPAAAWVISHAVRPSSTRQPPA